MLTTDLEKMFYTGGMYYSIIDRNEIDTKFRQQENLYTLQDLVPDKKYTIYRVVKTNDNHPICLKINAQIVSINEIEMLFLHDFPGKMKAMLLDDYLETWFFIPHDEIV